MKLTSEEIRLMRDLSARPNGEGTLTGNKEHRPLNRLVDLKFVSRQQVKGTTDMSIYALTQEGSAYLEKTHPL